MDLGRQVGARVLKAARAELDVQVRGEAEDKVADRHGSKAELGTDLSRRLRHRRKERGPADGPKSPIAQVAGPAATWWQAHPVGGDVTARVDEAGVA